MNYFTKNDEYEIPTRRKVLRQLISSVPSGQSLTPSHLFLSSMHFPAHEKPSHESLEYDPLERSKTVVKSDVLEGLVC